MLRAMRFDLLFVILAAAGAATMEPNIARPGGGYDTLQLASADACASACAEDALCMAWTLTAAGQCELKAIAPHPIAANGATSGLSARAPGFARLATPQQPAAAPPELRAQLPDILATSPPSAAHDNDADLLGGPHS